MNNGACYHRCAQTGEGNMQDTTGTGPATDTAASQVAIITGASSGIGRDLALKLAARGYHCVIMARRAERLASLKQDIEATASVKCHAIPVDLSDMDAARGAFEAALAWAREGGWALGLLANNAGAGEWRPFMTIPVEKQLAYIDLNVKVCTLYSRLFLDEVLEGGQRAYILNVASMASFLPVPNYAVYSGTKAYLRYLNEALNFELRGTKVSLTCLCPGSTETEFVQTAGNETTSLADMATMSSAKVAEIGLRATFKGRQVVVSGVDNRAVRILLALLPQSLGQRLLNLVLGLGMKKDWE